MAYSLITSGGMIWTILAIQSSSFPFTSSWVNWGTGSAAVTASTNLTGETGSRQTASSSRANGGITAQWSGTCTAVAIHTAAEAGVFTSSTSGAGGLILYGTYTPVPLEVNDKITYLFSLTMS